MKKSLTCRSPNNDEITLISIFAANEFPYKYVGDGTIIIGGKNPDFINIEKSKLIEFYGEYWHEPDEEEPRKQHFAKYGFDTLVIWGKELKNKNKDILISRIRRFHNQVIT